jgi:hypothetical protein
MEITMKNEILIVNFKGKKDMMNTVLDPISNAYEGPINSAREGHNFPASSIPPSHPLAVYKARCRYVIGIYSTRSLAHELMHAKFYLEPAYREKVREEWCSFSLKTQNQITEFLKRLEYPEAVHLDEFQAYRATEPENFFGFRLEESKEQSQKYSRR